MTGPRILVTGSRDWPDPQQVWDALDELRARCWSMTLVHGACRGGADAFADVWGRRRAGVTIERHPADWKRHGKYAGPIRNREMVELGADLCLAFIFNCSRGASGTAALAEEAGIRVKPFWLGETPPLIKAARSL